LVTTEFKSGGLHEKHVESTWKGGNHLSIHSWTQVTRLLSGPVRNFHSKQDQEIHLSQKHQAWI